MDTSERADEAIRFCLSLAEEHRRQDAGKPVQLLTITEIAARLRWLISSQA